MTATPTHDEKTSIGRTLKFHRERNNISVAEIASKMHLDSRIINAIEADKYSSLPDPIYVRGYIRSYSKLVNADADALVKLYEQHGGDFEPEIIPEVRHPTQSSSSDRPVKAVTYLISLVLVVLLIAWWQSNFMLDTPDPSTTATGQLQQETPDLNVTRTYSQSQPVPASTTNGEIIDAPGEDLDDINLDPEANLPGRINTDQPEALPPVTPATTDTQTGTDVPGVPVNTLTIEETAGLTGLDLVQPRNIDNTQTGRGPLPEPGVTVSSLPAVHQTNGPDLIVLRLTADSWIEIIDANNTKVFFDLGRPGDVFNVRGTAPFNVLLGFAQAVTLDFNGSPFNVAPHSRAGVARFKLGE